MVRVWRIATEGITYRADDMTGAGAAKDGGRWNSTGHSMVYSSESISLACLETLVHINSTLPLNRYLVAIDIPQAIWESRETLIPGSLVGWDAEPAGLTSSEYGDKWLDSKRTLIIQVPSVIVPEEHNVLINPLHVDASKLAVKKIRKWLYTPRLKKA